MLPSSLRSYLNEPAVADPPARVWRDWALVAVAAVVGVLEATLRADAAWVAVPASWRVASVVTLLITLPALLVRRTHPLAATVASFGVTVGFGVVGAIALDGGLAGLTTGAVMLVTAYALYRWGPGRHGAIGAVVLLAALVVGTWADNSSSVGDVIGGFIVLCAPVEIGLLVRYRHAARERAVAEATVRERTELARELHDTIAHHVSAIAVQAQAGRAVAAVDPERALAVLAVIEDTAKEALGEMRTMVRAWRSGADAELTPRQGLADLAQLARHRPGELAVEVAVDPQLGPVDAAVGTALYRIAQESVTNAVRHARRASRVRVVVARHHDLVRLTVADDGTSGTTAGGGTGALGDGYGLLGMTERAHLLGGRLTAGPAPDGPGWLVTAELPAFPDGAATADEPGPHGTSLGCRGRP